MSCWYKLIASNKNITPLEEMVFATRIHDDGLFCCEFEEGKKILDTYKINYTVIIKKYFTVNEIWGIFQITDEIPDWEEIYDKIRYQWKWNFKYFSMYGFLEIEWYNSIDLGDDIPKTPIEAVLINQILYNDIGDREIDDLFIATFIKKYNDKNIKKHRLYDEVINFLNNNKGKFAYILT